MYAVHGLHGNANRIGRPAPHTHKKPYDSLKRRRDMSTKDRSEWRTGYYSKKVSSNRDRSIYIIMNNIGTLSRSDTCLGMAGGTNHVAVESSSRLTEVFRTPFTSGHLVVSARSHRLSRTRQFPKTVIAIKKYFYQGLQCRGRS